MNRLIDDFKKVVGDISYILGEMSNGNFKVESQEEDSYLGDFEDIKHSMKKLKTALIETLLKIRDVANQVSFDSSQMAESAQGLAQLLQLQSQHLMLINLSVMRYLLY